VLRKVCGAGAGLAAHLGAITSGRPIVIPAAYGYDPDTVYLHGSVASQNPNTAGPGVHHHHPHRRAGARTVGVRAHYQLPQRHDPRAAPAGHRPAERLAGLRCITGHVAPGRWDYVRHPSRKELAAARLLALSLDQASVKIRPAIPRSLPYRAC
jgi:hypothetical protein